MVKDLSSEPQIIYTVGHGNRSIDLFTTILHAHEIKCLADIRSFPRSRRNPHFNQEKLAVLLPSEGITYVWLKELGGFRTKGLGAKSPHIALKNEGFRNYADHMATAEFKGGIEKLLALAETCRTAVMCAETLPFRCHRWLLSDYLLVRGCLVLHILDENRTAEHNLAQYASIRGEELFYDFE